MGCGLVPLGDRLRHCNLYPSAMQLSARYLPPLTWLDQTPLATECRSNPLSGMPSTILTTSHVTQYESTTPRGTDDGLDLWEVIVGGTFSDCAYGGSRRTAPLIHNIGTTRQLVVSYTNRSLYSWGKEPPIPTQ